MEATNVGRNNKQTVTTNMVVTYPGKDGIEISTKGQIISIRDYIKEQGHVSVSLIRNSDKDIKAYKEKYELENLKEDSEGR